MDILIRLPNHLGDAVMFAPVFEYLTKRFREARFHLVGSALSLPIYKNHIKVTTITIDESKKAKNRFFAVYKIAKSLPQCDIAISAQNHFYSALLLFLNAAKRRIGFKSFATAMFLNSGTRNIKLTNKKAYRKYPHLHQTLQYAKLVSLAINEDEKVTFKGILKANIYLEKIENLTQNEQEIIENLKIARQNHKLVGLALGANYGNAKKYPHFLHLADNLSKLGYTIVLTGTKDDAKIAYKIENLNPKSTINLTEKTSLEALGVVLKNLDLLICNDSGTMHLAGALGVELLALFGSTSDDITRPWMARGNIINLNLPCSPCYAHNCPLLTLECLEKITPSNIANIVEKMLNAEKISAKNVYKIT